MDWQKYINDEVADREQYELALTACPDCLQEYVGAVEVALESPSPGFSSAVMASIARRERIRHLKPLLHYVVAACLTLLFIEMGAFENYSSIFSEFVGRLESILGLIITSLGGM